MDQRDIVLEIEHRLGARIGIAQPGEPEHRGDMRDVLGADVGELGVIDEVIVAVGQTEARLAHADHVARRVLGILLDADAERHRDPGLVGGAKRVRKVGSRRDRGDLRHYRRERCKALRLDAGLIHIGGVIGADARRIGIAAALGRGLDDAARAFERAVPQHVERTEARLVGGDRRDLVPGAVGIVVEAVAGRDAAVHARKIEAEIAEFGLGRGRGSKRGQREQGSRGERGGGQQTHARHL